MSWEFTTEKRAENEGERAIVKASAEDELRARAETAEALVAEVEAYRRRCGDWRTERDLRRVLAGAPVGPALVERLTVELDQLRDAVEKANRRALRWRSVAKTWRTRAHNAADAAMVIAGAGAAELDQLRAALSYERAKVGGVEMLLLGSDPNEVWTARAIRRALDGET